MKTNMGDPAICCGRCKWWEARGPRQMWGGEIRDHGKCLRPHVKTYYPRCRGMITDIDDLCDESLFVQKDNHLDKGK